MGTPDLAQGTRDPERLPHRLAETAKSGELSEAHSGRTPSLSLRATREKSPLPGPEPLPPSLDLDEERQLVANAQRDPAAFSVLYERYFERIYRFIYRRVQSVVEAEDLTAQTFQQALAAIPSYEWRGVPFGAWLYRIAGNLVVRHRQISGREVAVEYIDRIVDERGQSEDPLDAMLRQTTREQLMRALQRLSPDQQRALILKYAHGLKNHEVGELMNRTEGGVKQLVHRAMLILRRDLAAAIDDCSVRLITAPRIDDPAGPTHAA